MPAMIDADNLAKARDVDLLATAELLGAKLKRVSTTELAGPCLVCAGRDRFSINRKQHLWHCRHCATGGGDAISLVMHVRGCSFREAVAYLTGEDATSAPARGRRAAEPSRDHGDYREKALALWREGVDPRRTVVELYLFGRALKLDDDVAGAVLRWHPRIGAMIALFHNLLTGEPQAVSRTFLDREGKKLGRKFLGPVAGAAVMLDPFDEVTTGPHIGEGVETCMTARQLGLRPCWALGSACAVSAFPVWGGIESGSTLLRENDDASERVCKACAMRWLTAGREVILNEPIGGKDLNDAIRGAS